MIRVNKPPILPIYRFFSMEDECFGVLKASWLKPFANFSGKDGDYLFFREKQFEGKYFLSSIGYSLLAQAHKPNGMGIKYEVEFHQQEYNLIPGDLFYDRLHLHYEIYKGEELLGSLIRGKSLFKFIVDIKADIPPIIQIFIFWLALRAWMGERGWRFSRPSA